MISKKRVIIKAFSEMNISKLKELLDDDKNYHLGLDKKSFIEKMNDVFDKFKMGNDTILTIHKGKCNSENCYLEGKCTGFSFVGNVSKNGINLNFEDGKYSYNCIQRCCDFEILNKRIKPISNFVIEDFDDLRF